MKRAELNTLTSRLLSGVKKYKFLLLIAAIGVILLLIPDGGTRQETVQQPQSEAAGDEDYAQALEERLTQILSRIDGAGQVRVLLTLQSGRHTVYQTDVLSESDGTQNRREENTVILSKGSAYDEAAISSVYYPRFQGALIVCEGADSAVVRLSLINAVSALTGLTSEKITVAKLK